MKRAVNTSVWAMALAVMMGCGNASTGGNENPDGGNVSTLSPRIYATVISHNEEDSNTNCKNGLNNDPSKYAANRALLKRLAEGIVGRGAAYDQQNEWLYLSRVADAAYETSALKAQTNNQNILAYLAALDPVRISIDVHHHNSGFLSENHADVAGRLEQLGVSERGVVGGFLFTPSTMAEVETMQGYAKNGLVSTKVWGSGKKTWFPKILWGGGSANHVSDSPASGVWRPKNNTAFYTDDPTSILPNVGHYQGNLDFTGMADLVAKQRAGMLSQGQMYTVTLMVNQCEMTDASVTAVLAEIDKYKDAVTAGNVVWKTLPDIVTEWKTVYGAQPQLYNAQ